MPQETYLQAGRLQTLNEISRVVSSSLDLRTLYDTIYEQVGRVMDTSQFFIALRHFERPILEIPYLWEEGRLSLGLELQDQASVTVRIIQSGHSFLFQNKDEFAQFARDHDLPELLVGDDDSESGIFVPLNTGSRTIGALTVQSKRPNAYTDEDVQTLAVIASQAAVAIENGRLYEKSQESVREMKALLHVAQAVSGSLDLPAVLDAILTGLQTVVKYEFASILLPDFDNGHLDVVAAQGPEGSLPIPNELRQITIIPFGGGITGKVFQRGEPLIIPDVRESPDYIDHGSSVLSEMAVPLRRGDLVVGVLDVEHRDLDAFSADDLALLQLFASQAAIAIENARLFATQERRVRELSAIQTIVQRLTPLHDIPSIAAMINAELQQLIDYHACRLFTLDSEAHALMPVRLGDSDPVGIRLHLGEGLTGSIAAEGRAERIDNSLLDPRSSQIVGTPRRAESVIGAPLKFEDRVQGVITLSKLGTHQFDDNDLRLLEIIAAQTAIAFDRARLTEELRTQAITDDLTGLFNRRFVMQRLREEQSRANRNHRPLAALMLDVDDFKQINDTFGHDAGDVVLREIAQIIEAEIRGEDVASRYGGEEFLVLLPEIPEGDCERVAERLRLAVSSHEMPASAGISNVTVSVGASLLTLLDQDTSLISRADAAMYQAKRRGGNAACVSVADSFHFVDGMVSTSWESLKTPR